MSNVNFIQLYIAVIIAKLNALRELLTSEQQAKYETIIADFKAQNASALQSLSQEQKYTLERILS